MPIFHRDSFPPGEAKGCMIYTFAIQRTTLSHNVRADAIRPYNCGGRAADGAYAFIRGRFAPDVYRHCR